MDYISSVQSLSHVQLFVILWTAAHQASVSVTNFWNLLKLKSIETVMPSSHLTLSHPLLLLSSIFPSIRVFSNESVNYFMPGAFFFEVYMVLVSSKQIEKLDKKGIQTKIIHLLVIKTVKADNLL